MDYPKPITVSTRQLPRKNINLKQMKDYIESLKKGSECFLCGYKRCTRSLHFHHKKPSEKIFGLGQYSKANSLDELKDEIKKCVLLCANCHSELHSNLFELI